MTQRGKRAEAEVRGTARRGKRAEAEARGAVRRGQRAQSTARGAAAKSAARGATTQSTARGAAAKSAVRGAAAQGVRAQEQASSVADRNERASKELEAKPLRIESEPLEPIRKVMREIVRPDGTILRVEVPVYPPFKLKERSDPKS